MRQGQQNRRGRGRGGRKPQNPLARSYESNGPDVKIRGTAAHIAEKYMSLARDLWLLATSSRRRAISSTPSTTTASSWRRSSSSARSRAASRATALTAADSAIRVGIRKAPTTMAMAAPISIPLTAAAAICATRAAARTGAPGSRAPGWRRTRPRAPCRRPGASPRQRSRAGPSWRQWPRGPARSRGERRRPTRAHASDETAPDQVS